MFHPELVIGRPYRIEDRGMEPNPYIFKGFLTKETEGTITIYGTPICDCCKVEGRTHFFETFYKSEQIVVQNVLGDSPSGATP